jgi:hypothetical protein
MRASIHLSKQKRRSKNMIFSVTYCQILTGEATSVETHATTFEAVGRTEALGIIAGWMEYSSQRGGVVQVIKIDIEDAQLEPMEHGAIVAA